MRFSFNLNQAMAATHFIPCLLTLVLISFLHFNNVSAIPLTSLKTLNTIKVLNKKGPYLGLITVYPPEENAFFATGVFKPEPKHPFVDLSVFHWSFYYWLVRACLATASAYAIQFQNVIFGQKLSKVNAAATTQQMLDLFNIIGVVHFGIAGNANNSMSIGDVTIPKQFAHTGIWDWLKPNATLPANDVTHLDIGSYNVPKGDGNNLLGRIGFSYEQFFSHSGTPNAAQQLLWAHITQNWLQLAATLEGMELERCVNSRLCLPHKPKVVVGLRGSTANIFVDNAPYREFLFQTFQVSSVDMESAAVVMISLSNGFPVIVIRGLSDLAGGQPGKNPIDVFGPLAALNAAKVVAKFIKKLS